MISFPFDGTLTTVETLTAADQKTVDVPVTDRGYDSKTLREIYDSLYTDGIRQDIANCLKVSPGTGMNVIVSPGICKAGGAFGIEDSQRTLAVQASNPTYDRIDIVVARCDSNNTYRNVDLYVVQGTPATSPKAPEPTRNESVYEIVLAHVFVAKGTTSISDYRITDTRLNSSLCGLMQGRPGTNTTGIFDQYQAALDEFLSLVQSAIDETTAGNLQKQIDETSENLQNQIDELIGKIYPVGSIYMSVSPTNPGTLFGGTWVAWGSGRVPVGINTSDSAFNSVEKTGGSKEAQKHTHTITVKVKSGGTHSHDIPTLDKVQMGGSASNRNAIVEGSSGVTKGGARLAGSHTHTASGTASNYGSGNSGNLQPYIVCYMWKRTA